MNSEFSTRRKLGPGPGDAGPPAERAACPADPPAWGWLPACARRPEGLGSKVVELMAYLPPVWAGTGAPVVISEWYSTSSLVSSM